VTLTACPVDDENDDDPDEIENGENGGVAGKRLKSYVISQPNAEDVRSDYSYNNDGTLKQIDVFQSSTRVMYVIITSYPDGTVAKQEQHISNYPLITIWNFTNDTNKKPFKREGSTSNDGNLTSTHTVDFTFQSGRKTREVEKIHSFVNGVTADQEIQRVFSYDNNGRRTTTTETSTGTQNGTRQYIRTYNSDGTLQKVNYPSGYNDNTPVTITFTWEDGKSPHNFDDYAQF